MRKLVVTFSTCALRSLKCEEVVLLEKARERYDQRPCSTQLTGIEVSLSAATRIEVLSTRFCFAPINSSPMTKSTGSLPVLRTDNVGTLPPSLTSLTSRDWVA